MSADADAFEEQLRRPHAATDDITRLASATASAAEEDGERALAAEVRAELARAGGSTASVVVVGEKKRGKSSLINALVGQPGLLPVDADVATSVHIAVGHAVHATAWVHDEESPQGRKISLDQVADYAAVVPGTAHARHDGVSQVRILGPSPLLARGLTLIDTPGVGGLVAGHAAITLATLDRADALLFVVSGHSELTASELVFLEHATERIATVLFVLTQFDKAPGWRSVLARNHELVARHAPRHAGAPWYVVNSRARADARRAERDGRPDVAARRMAASGLVELEEVLGGLAAGSDALRLTNVVFRCRQVADVLVGAATRRAESMSLDPSFSQRVAQSRAELEARGGQGAAWRNTLGDRLSRTDTECRRILNRQVEEVRLAVGEQIHATAGLKGLREVTDSMPDRVNALWMNLAHHLSDRLLGDAEAVSIMVGVSTVDLSALQPERPERLENLPEATRRRGGQSLAEHGMMAMGLGSVVGGLLSTIATPIVGVPAGAAVVGLVARVRHGREEASRSRQAAQDFLARVVDRVHTEVPPVVQETIAEAKRVVTAHITTHVDARRAELEAALEEHQKLFKAEKDTVMRARSVADQRLAQRRKLVDAATAIAGRLAVEGGSW